MDIHDRGLLKRTAAQRIDGSGYSPRRLILVHTLVTIGVSALTLVITDLLDARIAQTGGLSGLDTRTTLSTLQSLVSYLPMVLALFWDVGYLYAMMNIARGNPTGLRDLPEGFRRWGKVLRFRLVWFLLYFAVGFAAVSLAIIIFFMTPMSNSIVEVIDQGMANGAISADGAILDSTVNTAITEATMPAILLCLVILAAAMLLMSYPFRFGLNALLDGKQGAFASLSTSAKLMRGNKAALFRLDLSYWWYYLLLGLVSALPYADMFLSMLGVPLPFDSKTAGYIAYGLYLAALLGLYVLAKNRVELTYVLFYDTLRGEPTPNAAPDPAPQPKTQPWNYG